MKIPKPMLFLITKPDLDTKVKISSVSYINSLPFIYGLENDSNILNLIDLQKDIPSVCADKLINHKVDIGLIPLAEISKIKNAKIISNYCIGSCGKVETVSLFSQVPVKEIKRVYLDFHSRTSVQLLKILFKHYWKMNPEYILSENGFEEKISANTAGLIIGDRTFRYNSKFEYVFDLSEEWMNFTKLPFVFAVWVSFKDLPEEFLNKFNNALAFGLSNKHLVISNYIKKNPDTKIDIENYLNTRINYYLDPEKKRGMDKFLTLLKSI